MKTMENFNEFEELMWDKSMEEGLLKKLKGVLDPGSEFIPTKDLPFSLNNCWPVSEELGLMIQKEIKSLEGRIQVIDKAIDELDKKEKLTKFFEDFRSEGDGGALFELDTLITSTEKAHLLDVDELGEVWIPKTQCKINGNLLFIRNYLIDERGFKDGESMHLKDWEKLVPDHYNIYQKSFRVNDIDDLNENQSNYCGACMESPCMCSDPY